MFDNLKTKERSDDRILVLEPIGDKVKNTLGIVDNRLFKGGNNLHALKEINSNLWYLKYDVGGLPEPLKQKYTSFAPLLKLAERYFETRGVRIAEVRD